MIANVSTPLNNDDVYAIQFACVSITENVTVFVARIGITKTNSLQCILLLLLSSLICNNNFQDARARRVFRSTSNVW